MLFILFYEWFELCLVDLHGVVIGCKHHMFRLQQGGVNYFNVSDDSQRFSYQHSKSWFVQLFHLRSWDQAWSKESLSRLHGVQIEIGSWT